MEGKDYGKVIKAARIANNYTIKEAAELAKVSAAYIGELENGHKTPSLNMFKELAKIYNLAPSQLMELVECHESSEEEELKKYQLILIKVLEILMQN